MIKVDENDPIGELQPSFPYRDVVIKRNVDVNEYYDLESEIGRGKFGTVYRCKEKSTGLTLAAKFVGIARRQDRRNVEREVEIMRTLQHPRLIQLYDAFEANSVMCVIQELIEGGELFERVIDDDFILTEKACTVFMRQICEGVEFIHSQNILHLDLKPENILCLTRTGNRIKIIDFGLARKFEPDKKLQVLFGTPEFVAPEVVNFEQIGFGTDMWSVGVICYVLLSGLSPFMGETDVETMANVTIAQYDFDDEAFDDISDDAKDFISKLLMKNKENRLTATECLSHIWLRRKPPPPPPPQQTQLQQTIELVPQSPVNEILDNTKENLREFVDRWTEQGGASPSKIISLPTIEPLKEVINNNVTLPQIVSDINKSMIKDETKVITHNSESKMETDNNVLVNNNQQNITNKLFINPNDRISADATQIDSENEIPGKKLKLDTAVSSNSTVTNNIILNAKLHTENPTNFNSIPSPFVVSQPTPVEINTGIGTVPKIPSNDKIYPSQPSQHNENNVNTVFRSPLGNKVEDSNEVINRNFSPSPVKTPPSSPIGTIPKIPSGSKLRSFPSISDQDIKNKEPAFVISAINQTPAEMNTSTGTVPKIPSNEKIYPSKIDNINNLQAKPVPKPEMNETNELPERVINNSKNKDSLLGKQEERIKAPVMELNENVNDNNINVSRSNEAICKPNVIGSKSNETVHKPPQIPNLIGAQRPKLAPQFSVPNDLSKCKLNKNIPASDNLIKANNLTNTSSRTDLNKNSLSNIDNKKELTSSDGKFSKTLNKHVVPPKIHGIVLGQNDDSPTMPEKTGPKVITHKIFVEGRTDPILPPTAASLANKENKKNDNRVPKPISKSQTSTKLELKENNSSIKSKPIGNRFFDKDRFDRRGSDISCFLHNTENLERINLADEIKKLSSRLLQMGSNATDDLQQNNILSNPIPISSFRNDPIGRFLANHGVVTRRPKYRMSNLNRDVPIGSPPPASNLFYHLAHSNSDTWSDKQTHSAPQSPSASPERESTSLSKDVILRLFEKNNTNPSLPKEEEKHPTMSSIDSLASYFKANNENKKNIPPVVTSK